ncbi:MAG: hypothetical protein ACKOYJ_09110 [Planctomycetia bacterium]
MSVIRVGSSGTYASGWDTIFGGGTAKVRKKSSAKTRKAATPKAAKPKASKPRPAKRSKKASKRR